MATKFVGRATAGMTPDERFAFDERVAICTFHGRLTEAEAIQVALDDFRRRDRVR